MKYVVELHHGQYRTTETVFTDDPEGPAAAIATAKARARRRGFYFLPMAYESARVISTTEDD